MFSECTKGEEMLPFVFLLLVHGYFEARRIIVRKYTVYFDNLPDEFDGYSILHVSDFHFVRHNRWVRTIAEYIRNLPADIGVMTGDYRCKNYTDWAGPLESMGELARSFRTRDGLFACLGNKESVGIVPAFEDMGIRVLFNSNVRLRRNGGELYLLGVDGRNPYRDFSTDANDSLRGIPKGAFKILLAHTPDYVKWARLYGIDLMLTGDTHGGQIRLPILGALRVKSKVSRKYSRGWVSEGGLRMFVNSGLGSVNIPVRTFCPPEISVIVLRKGSLQ
jgi:predicted MPP superfamily phosphohydrolase